MGAQDRWVGRVRVLLRPHIFLPVLLAAALLFFLLSISNLPEVFGRIRGIPFSAVAACFAAALWYLTVKGAVFRALLRGLGYSMGWRPFTLAYAIGELAVTVPSGVYAQNYVLSRLRVAPPGHSSAATTVMILLETMVVMTVLAILGIPGWDWLRSLMVLLILAHLAAIGLVVNSASVRKWLGAVRGRLLGAAAGGLLRMIEGVRQLGRPGTMAVSTLLTLAYLLGLGVGMLIIGHAAGLSGLTLPESLSIYFVALWVTLLVGSILTQLGVIEAVALGAAQAYGYGIDEALAVILGFRVTWIGSVWLLCAPLALYLRGELRKSGNNHLQETAD
ncbi:lysylphosphatidylglycerol synthase domain-containing protein [Thiohalorhabdus methylotrophus]|uniref:Lysylphosphatidylglycerol synthase domain-containing protein n=1 Tax=Thiohalorhabdus methylotrophus TaxID=3242694 RepID=A0ABV4TUU3_9GAMM